MNSTWGNLPNSPYYDERCEEMKPAEMSNIELLLAMVETDTIIKNAGEARKESKDSIIPFMTEKDQYKAMLSILEQDEIIMNARKGFSELIAEARVRKEQLKDLIRRGEISLQEDV